MRLSAQPRVLWIDALCISQSDLVEKAQQVHMIGKIVHHASSVLAWLGEHADGSEAIFRGWPAEEAVTADMPPASIPLDFWTRRLEVWLAFISRRWSSRTWIIQEVVVAKEVHLFCGRDIGHWTTMFEDLMTRMIDTGLPFGGGGLWAVLDGVKDVSSVDFEAKVIAFLPERPPRMLRAQVQVYSERSSIPGVKYRDRVF